MATKDQLLANRPLQEDESRLLLDDPNNFQYGSFGEQNANTHTDPLESQRELEALQKVVAKTSKYGSPPRATASILSR